MAENGFYWAGEAGSKLKASERNGGISTGQRKAAQVAMHGVVEGYIAGRTGGNLVKGAAITAVNKLIINELGEYLDSQKVTDANGNVLKDENGVAIPKFSKAQEDAWLMQASVVIGVGAGAATGEDGIKLANMTTSATKNNYLSHRENETLKELAAKCKEDITSPACDSMYRLATEDARRDEALKLHCGKNVAACPFNTLCDCGSTTIFANAPDCHKK